MSQITGGWELIREATADRQIDEIIVEHVDEVDQQLVLLDALYEMFHNQQYIEVALLLRAFQGEWV